ncbi:MAG: hypothetical protein WBX00_05250 [Isosphaeraceae bacterium]
MNPSMVLVAVLLAQASTKPNTKPVVFHAGDRVVIANGVNENGLVPEIVAVVYQEKFLHVANPTRGRITTGRRRKEALVFSKNAGDSVPEARVVEKPGPDQKVVMEWATYEVELLEGPQKGQKVMVGTACLRKDTSTPQSSGRESTPPSSSPPSSHSDDWSRLDRGYISDQSLTYQGTPVVCLCVDDKAWDQMLDAQNKGDLEEIAMLVAKEKVAFVPRGTRVKCVKTGFTSLRLRVSEGPSAGVEGWLQRELVRKGEPPAEFADRTGPTPEHDSPPTAKKRHPTLRSEQLNAEQLATATEKALLKTEAGFPSIAGVWQEGPAENQIRVTITQNVDKFTATCRYHYMGYGEIRWRMTGTISKDGEIKGSVVHTKAPRGWLNQTRTGKFSATDGTITGHATFRGGGHDFEWKRLDN